MIMFCACKSDFRTMINQFINVYIYIHIYIQSSQCIQWMRRLINIMEYAHLNMMVSLLTLKLPYPWPVSCRQWNGLQISNDQNTVVSMANFLFITVPAGSLVQSGAEQYAGKIDAQFWYSARIQYSILCQAIKCVCRPACEADLRVMNFVIMISWHGHTFSIAGHQWTPSINVP